MFVYLQEPCHVCVAETMIATIRDPETQHILATYMIRDSRMEDQIYQLCRSDHLDQDSS